MMEEDQRSFTKRFPPEFRKERESKDALFAPPPSIKRIALFYEIQVSFKRLLKIASNTLGGGPKVAQLRSQEGGTPPKLAGAMANWSFALPTLNTCLILWD